MRAGMKVLTAMLMGIAVVGCSPTRPAVVTAADQPFPGSFVDAGEWEANEVVLLPGAPSRFTSFDVLQAQLTALLQAGIKVPRPGSGVTVTVPDGASDAQEVHLFVTIIGGATEVSSGQQLRLVVRHDARGWWLDPAGESRLYCDQPLSGRFGNSCH